MHRLSSCASADKSGISPKNTQSSILSTRSFVLKAGEAKSGFVAGEPIKLDITLRFKFTVPRSWKSNMARMRLRRVSLLALVVGALVQAQGMTYREPRIYEVGGPGAVWAIPSTPTFFQKWASTITFRAGDVLQFNKPAPGDIGEIHEDEAYYDGCDTLDSVYTHYWANDGDSVLFGKLDSRAGIHHVNHVSPSNCTKGLQFAVTVGSLKIPDPPVQPPTTTKLQGRAAQVFEVGGIGRAWAVPPNNVFFVNWAANISFRTGDTLRFNFDSADYEVSKVPLYEQYESCTTDVWRSGWSATSGSTTYTFEKPGVHYFLASGPAVQYCVQGMKLAAFVYCEDGSICVVHKRKSVSWITVIAPPVVGLLLLLVCCWWCCGSENSGRSSSGAGGATTTTQTTTPRVEFSLGERKEQQPGRAAWDGDGNWNTPSRDSE